MGHEKQSETNWKAVAGRNGGSFWKQRQNGLMCHIPDIKITGCADGFGCGIWGKEESRISPRFLASRTLGMMVPLADIWKTGHQAQCLLRKLVVQFFPW